MYIRNDIRYLADVVSKHFFLFSVFNRAVLRILCLH